jgi:hypothetical protein
VLYRDEFREGDAYDQKNESRPKTAGQCPFDLVGGDEQTNAARGHNTRSYGALSSSAFRAKAEA